MRSWYQWSRPSVIGISASSPDAPVRCTTTTSVIDGVSAERDVRRRLEQRGLAPAPAAVGGDEHLRLGVVDAVGQRVGREPAEHDRVGGADPGAGQQGHRQLGDHRHVDGDPVALLDAEALQRVGEALHLGQQVGVGDRAGVARLALPVERDLVAPARLDVAVEAVAGDVERAADEPLGEGQVPLEDRVPLAGPSRAGRRPGGPRTPRSPGRPRRRGRSRRRATAP